MPEHFDDITKSYKDLKEIYPYGNKIDIDSAAELISEWNHTHWLNLDLTNNIC